MDRGDWVILASQPVSKKNLGRPLSNRGTGGYITLPLTLNPYLDRPGGMRNSH